MDKNKLSYSLMLENKIGQLRKLEETISEVFTKWNIPDKEKMSVNLALEEIFTNIVNYGYKDNNLHQIEIRFSKSDKNLIIKILDDGQYYDITKQSDPDITIPAEDRPVGGLGIFLVKNIMDSLKYQREEDKNCLTLVMHL